MNDKELLELAALAAGIECDDKGPFTSVSRYDLYNGMHTVDLPWNPLDNDSDALRLAVKLRLLVECGYLTVDVRYNYDEVEQWSLDDAGVTESVHGDIYAATRRAIVRAAAEIGKPMKVH